MPGRTAIRPASMSISPACICDEIKVSCTIQARRFDTLLDALNENRGDAVIASIAATAETRATRRFHRSLLPHAGALRGARRQPARRRAAGTARGQEDRGGRRHRARGLPQGDVHRGRGAALSQRRGGARGAAQQGRRSSVRRRHRAGVLAQRHRLGRLLRLPRRAVSGEPLFRRRRRHRGEARQRSVAAGASTGRCSGCGRRAASPICGCAISRSARFERMDV